jgi:hypothetical protein
VWVANIGLTYLISINQLTTNTELQEYWQSDFFSFPPDIESLKQFYFNLLQISTGVYLPLPWHTLFSLTCLALGGILFSTSGALDKYKSMVVFLLFPATLVASTLQFYPIRGRFLLFLAPPLFLLISNGVRSIHMLAGKSRLAMYLISGLMVLAATWNQTVTATLNFVSPPLGEDIKPALAYIQQNKQVGDIVYVYYGGQAAFEYYRRAFGFEESEVVMGIESRVFPEKYKSDVRMLKGRDRVWFLFSHNCDNCAVHEQKYYLQYLGGIGDVLDRFSSSQVRVYLFDLNP